jgi:hypothetical protein
MGFVAVTTTYILIDHENVQATAAELSGLDADSVKVLVFVGTQQSKLTFELAEQMQRLGDSGRYVKASGNGPNALDFHIAFYLGQLVEQDPKATFVLVSKDKGFDPLVVHLNAKQVAASRVASIAQVRVPPKPAAKKVIVADTGKLDGPEDRMKVVLADLTRRGASRPRTLKTLTNTVGALFRQTLKPDELDGLIRLLQTKGVITVDGTKVRYTL